MTRSSRGSGYTLHLIDDDTRLRVRGYGIMFPMVGEWTYGGLDVPPMTALEFIALGDTSIVGRGGIAGVVTSSAAEDDVHTATAQSIRLHGKPWGWELEALTTMNRLQLKLLYVAEGHRTSEQYHEYKDEVMIHILDDEAVHVAPRTVHRVTGQRLYFEASTYHPTDVVRVSDDYGR